MNAEFSNTSFQVRRAALGAQNFLGNDIVYPAGGRTGDDCLLATKVMVPIAGRVREGVGLLGSPCFEIPRSVHRDSAFDDLKTGDEQRRRLRAKNRHNTVTALLYLLANLVNLYIGVMVLLFAVDLYERFGFLAVAVAGLTTFVFSIAFFVLLERAVTGFRALSPQFCSIYDPYFWWHERFWKMSAGTYLALFNGTPMKNLLWRALGVRVGRRVFDDGCAIPEKSLVTIGDGAALNAGSAIQAHSLEDGTFKSDRVTIGAGCTLGTGAFVHYGVRMRDGAVLDADSFLMKGEDVPARARYRGNPAREVREPVAGPRVPVTAPVIRKVAPVVVALAACAVLAAMPSPRQVAPIPVPQATTGNGVTSPVSPPSGPPTVLGTPSEAVSREQPADPDEFAEVDEFSDVDEFADDDPPDEDGDAGEADRGEDTDLQPVSEEPGS
jgi:hypothetical protein